MHHCVKTSPAGSRMSSQFSSADAAIKIAKDHTWCIQGQRSVVTHRGDRPRNHRPDARWHGQTPTDRHAPDPAAGPRTEAPTAIAAENGRVS
jgi:hypothetical protein